MFNIKLFSSAHMKAAVQIFPEQINYDWCKQQWTDNEINICKALELKSFISRPSLSTYPIENHHLNLNNKDQVKIVDQYILLNPQIKTMLSVGCGLAETEIYLAKKYPDLDILCIDNAPYVENLNTLARELKLKNLEFRNLDFKDGLTEEFDLVFSMSVIYCIPDKSLEDFFNSLNKAKKPGGHIIVGCSSNLSLFIKLRLNLKKILISFKLMKDPINSLKLKQIGWLRSAKSILLKIPSTIKTTKVKNINHYNNNYPKIINLISEKIYPLTNTGYMFFLK